MTRDDAIKTVCHVYAVTANNNSGLAQLVDALIAIGVLKVDEPKTCKPPTEDTNKRWHWLRHELAGSTITRPFEWDGSRWGFGEWEPPEYAHKAGWRYHSVCKEPTHG